MYRPTRQYFQSEDRVILLKYYNFDMLGKAGSNNIAYSNCRYCPYCKVCVIYSTKLRLIPNPKLIKTEKTMDMILEPSNILTGKI